MICNTIQGINYACHATTKGAWITLIKPFGWSKVKQSSNTNFILNVKIFN